MVDTLNPNGRIRESTGGFYQVSELVRINKLIISFTLLVASFEFVTIVQYANGYRLSMYQQIPGFLLALGALVTVASVFISLWFLVRGIPQTALLALSPLIGQVMLVLVLPYLLGYQIQAGDMMVHAGDIRTIEANGHIGSVPRSNFGNQFRPMYHLLFVAIDQVTEGLYIFPHRFVIFGVIDILQSGLFMLFVGLFCRRAGFPAVYSVFSSLAIVFTGVLPSNFAHETLFVLALYILSRLTSPEAIKRDFLIFVLLSVSLWPFHQLPPVLLVVISFLVLPLSASPIRSRIPSVGLDYTRKITFPLLLLPVVVGVPGYLWWTYAPYFRMGIQRLFGLGSTTTLSATEQASTLFDKFGFTLPEFIFLVIKTHGPLLLVLSLAGIGGLIAITPQTRIETRRVPAILFLVLGISIIWTPIEFFGGNLIAGWTRALLPGRLIAPIFGGLFLFEVIRRMRRYWSKRFVTVVILFILLGAIFSVGFTLHQARLQSGPWVASSNNNLVESEIDAWDWYFSTKSRGIGTVTLARDFERFEDLLFTAEERQRRHAGIRYGDSNEPTKVAPHFGGNVSMGELYGDVYYLDSAAGRLNRLVVHPEWGVFTRVDFTRLLADRTTSRIYQNGNVNIYYISKSSN